MKATNLKVEYLTNPVGIDVVRPRFGWNFEARSGDLRTGELQTGKFQTAYRIYAHDDSGNTLWDSGCVKSNKMHLVEWGGEDLKSRTSVTWNVTVWDEKGEAEQSADAYFETGLLNPDDWTAKWITGNYKPHKNKRYPADTFKKEFFVDEKKKIKKARAYMTACGIYVGKLNGEKMGNFMLAPGITDYRKRVQYQTVDIGALITAGKNELTFTLADGWYRGSVGAWGIRNFYGKETKLLAQIEITYEDGTRETVQTDETFMWNSDGPVRQADNKDGEIYDAKREDYVTDASQKARVTKHSVIPTASNNFPLTEHEKLVNPAKIVTPSGKTVLDFRQNIAGVVEFSFYAKKGHMLTLRMGELMRDGEFTQKNIQCVRGERRTPLQEIKYICKDGENTYKTEFAIFGFRYIEVTADFEINPADFCAIAVYSDFETTFEFDSSNELLNKFVKNTLWALKNNSADLPTDCPTRERHGWTGDAQIFVNTASYMVNFMPFAMKFENDLRDAQKKSGKIPQIAPVGGTDFYMRAMDGSVGWSDACVLIPYRLWKKYGDRDVIKKYYDSMKRYACFMIKRTGKHEPFISERTGLKGKDKKYLYNFGQHYGEWAEPADVKSMTWRDFAVSRPEEATAYLYYVMSVMIEIAEELGEKEDIPLFKEYCDGAKRAYESLRHLPDFSLDTDRQSRLVRPLYFGLLNDKDTEYVRERLIKALDNYKWRVGTGFLSTPFILYVLSDIDKEAAYRLLENEEKPGWLCMPKHGATSIWEDWAGPDSDNGKGGGIASLNHYSKGAVLEWVFEKMCGIKVDGENNFLIEPVPGGHFKYAGMTYKSVYGAVSVKWERTGNGEYKYKIVIPPNTTATVRTEGKNEMILTAGEYEI